MVMAELQSPFEEGLYPYWAKRDGVPGIIVPQNAAAPAGTPGLSYAWGAWAPITAGLAFPFVLSGAFIHPGIVCLAGTAFLQHDTQWEIGQGAAGAEVPIASGQVVRAFANPSPNTLNIAINHSYTWRCDPRIIPAGTRLAIRWTQSSAVGLLSTSSYLFGYDARAFNPIAGNIDLRRWLSGHRLSPGTMVVPLAAGGTAVTAGGGAWVFGAWVPMMTAARDMLVTGVSNEGGALSRYIQGEIALGAPGAEVSEEAFAFPGRLVTWNQVGTIELYRPVFVKAGEAVSLRHKGHVGGTVIDFWLHYRELY